MSPVNRNRSFLVVAVLFLVANALFSQSVIDLYADNDSQSLKPNGKTDRHYTNGTKIVYTTDMVPEWDLLSSLGGWCFDGDYTSRLGIFVGQNLYTPDYVDELDRQFDVDMKFAGWLYSGIFMQRADSKKIELTELNVGLIGPSAFGEDTQEFVHDLMDKNEPYGWENQLSDEMTFDFSYYVREKSQLPLIELPEGIDFMTEYGFTAGTLHRHAELGFILRCGFNLDDDFGPGRLDKPIGHSSEVSDSKASYLFVRANGKAVEHNRFLTGLSEKPLVGALEVGLMHHYKSLKIGYSQTFYTREFEEQHGVDRIGSIVIGCSF